MNARARVAAALAIALASTPALAAEPRPSDVEEARKHYQRGVQLYEQGVDQAALAELERAYELVPSWKVLYDIALVEQQMHDVAGALRDFQRYLDEGKDDVTAPRRAEVEKRLGELRDQVATIDVGAPPGAAIAIDDVPAGTAPLPRAIVLNPGRHKVGATKDGRVAEGRVVSVAGGDRIRVDLTIPEAPPAPPAPEPGPVVVQPPPPPPTPQPAPRSRSYVWVGWVASGAFAAGAVVTGLEALSANSDLSHAKSDTPTPGDQLEALSSRAHHWALASDLLALGAIGAAGTSLYFTLRRPPSSASVSVGVAIAPNGVALRGAF
jgi:hypothetical protein